MTRLHELTKLGQSPWYDNLSRGLIRSGGLQKLIASGMRGVTTNPTIFEKAIVSSPDYDRSIKELTELGKSAEDIYDELTADDVREACDLLADTYSSSGGTDGFVSIEVLPRYAGMPDETVDYAKHIASKVGRENLLVKVPGTEGGFKAIRALIREGISINVTLLFSVEHYRASAQAYIQGISDRLKDGKDISRVRSVASVFVSRVDTAVDKLLDAKDGAADLKGKAAVANSKLIYAEYKRIFADRTFTSLAERGAQAQRLLWASTGTKDPAYSDTKYVVELIGRDTVNTMPQQTADAFLVHGTARLSVEDDIETAKEAIAGLKKHGIFVDAVCRKLQDEGVRAFEDSFTSLINSIEMKRAGFAKTA